MDVTALREGVRAATKTIPGLQCFAFLPGTITPPTFFVGEAVIEFDRTFGRGMDEVMLTARLLVSLADDESAQRSLDKYLKGSGPHSIKEAVEAERTLGGACADLHVQRVTGWAMYEHADTQYLGAEFAIRVIGEGD